MQREHRFRLLSVLSMAVAVVMSAVSVLAHGLHASTTDTEQVFLGTLALVFLAIVGEELAVDVSDRMSVAASNLPLVLAVMFLGPESALGIAALVGVWRFWREASPFIVLFNLGNYVTSCALAVLVFDGTRVVVGFSPDHLGWGLLAGGALAGATYEVANGLLVSLAPKVRLGRSIRAFWASETAPLLRSLGVLLLLTVAIAALYVSAGIMSVALLFIPLFASQYMFKLLVREREHLATQKQLADQYLEMNIGLAAAMVVLLDSKDEYTAQHSAAVAMYCRDMALAMGMDEHDAEAVHLAGLLHDLGKVGTPDAVLKKQGDLDREDWEFMRQHPEKGAEVLSHLANYQDVADIVRYHHERLDGSGYPAGVSGPAIPELSKLLAVADSYHAMTSDRPYRSARSSFEALKELRRMSGVTLDSRYVEVLARILRDKDLAYRDGSSTDFMGEYERGRINLRLRGRALADVSGLAGSREDPAAS